MISDRIRNYLKSKGPAGETTARIAKDLRVPVHQVANIFTKRNRGRFVRLVSGGEVRWVPAPEPEVKP